MVKEEKENFKKRGIDKVLILGIFFIIAVSVVIIIIKPSTPTGNVVKTSEKTLFEIIDWKITPNFIEVQLKNTGAQDYTIQQINIEGCGIVNGGTVFQNDYDGRIFTDICTKPIESSSFMQRATILYSSFNGDIGTQEFIIAGEVSKKKCVYEVRGLKEPYVGGECNTKWNCLEGYVNLTETLGVNTEDIKILNCTY